ncbi:hypothetical protein CPB86DRAFT_754211 [Serendipita vermifera]|nr:hypothetical protein CPB86DRAFT_754211 [Serendipita vermifera]
MWCTRWFIPLFLLPVPVTRPYFLLLYLISALFHARPCLYCVVILISLAVTSCHWSPVPLSEFQSSSLSTLNGTEQQLSGQLKYVEMLSRCWCDFKQTPFFGHYNVTQWEIDSLRAAINGSKSTSSVLDETQSDEFPKETHITESTSSVPSSLPWIRTKYDLRPHGIDLIVDFGWSNSD